MTDASLSLAAFMALVEETFDRPSGSIVSETCCIEIPGWDSLGHSVFLSRLSRRHALALTESDAIMDSTVGEMYFRLANVKHVVSL